MANEQIKQNFKDIANAIRSKTGENGLIKAEEMASKIESIETGITPSGSLDITANGNNIDVTTKATVNVNVPGPSGTTYIYNNGDHNVAQYGTAHVSVPIPIAQVDDSSNFRILRKLDKIEFSEPENRTYAVISSGDYEIGENFSIEWSEFENNFSFKYLRGGYDSIENFSQNRCIILSAILTDTETFNEHHYFSITLNGIYTQYSGSYTIEELQTRWEQAFQGAPVYDLTGRIVGYVDSCYASIETRSDS